MQTFSSARAHAPATSELADDEIRLIGATRTFDRDEQIFGEGDAADCVYKVVSGAVRCLRRLADGRRQITEFYLPGDMFGVELGATRHSTTEALGETVLLVARRNTLTVDQSERLWRLALRDLHRAQEHVLTLGRRSASERIARLLVELAQRLDADGELKLPMSRLDMADYLGLTIETVSRVLTQLQAEDVIRLSGRRGVRAMRPAVLADLCE
ncbi:MAG TPA: helix-turn-helix domain-containing protein [Caulobacteraceae bacterium]|jgi:CRP-like cAMP-binding protein